jgi:hypothetical protein
VYHAAYRFSTLYLNYLIAITASLLVLLLVLLLHLLLVAAARLRPGSLLTSSTPLRESAVSRNVGFDLRPPIQLRLLRCVQRLSGFSGRLQLFNLPQ